MIRQQTLQDSINKCYNITAHFEGASYTGLTGNSDSMGFSFGLFQFNLGQGTLQKLLLEIP